MKPTSFTRFPLASCNIRDAAVRESGAPCPQRASAPPAGGRRSAEGPSAPPARWGCLSSPLGVICVAVDAAGAVVALAFGGFPALQARAPRYEYREDAGAIASVRRQLDAYWTDPRHPFTLPLAPQGTAFQLRVWSALRAIPAGETRSYGQIAAELGGSPGGTQGSHALSPRAVGRANATNPICLIIPCHRVIGSDGSLTGFAFGEAIKRGLLAHEGVNFPCGNGGSRRRTLSISPGP